MSAPLQVFTQEGPFELESGACLPHYHLAYTTHGRLNASGDNVVWIFHALTANSDPAQWWPGLVGEGKLFDPDRHFIVCVNMPGSCYGSIGPLSIKPGTDEPYYHDFPFFTTRDMIRAYRPLREFLGINRIHMGIGGSMGGQQLLEWAIEEPELFQYIVPIATNARHSPWGIAFNTSQRMAIEADETWKQRKEEAGRAGMRAARATALLSYRHYDTYMKLQPGDHADSYQRYQGEKLVRRFSAFSYYTLSQSMDSHDTGRGRGGPEFALQRIRAHTLVIGIGTDILFPLTEQEYLAAQIPGAVFVDIPSLYGHDGFLLEFEQIEKLVRDFVRKEVQEEGPLEKNRLDLP
ncbi:MAG: homoserine O-acetyltransferase [Bacteroidota bacterium]|nr:homoserine O-acetyltransferase [Bacteroidota bacterium]MDP4218441.1 homoserine O-acetyltransferase [Bacteroidota bacterium]MDP4244557.1 homoserine O-acetyltransferase [Bacteroidota bacterium]